MQRSRLGVESSLSEEGARGADLVREFLDAIGGFFDVFLGLAPLALFEALANSGKGLYAVAGVEAGRVDLVAEPWTAGEALFARQPFFALIEYFV